MAKAMRSAWICFAIHFLVEFVCFASLAHVYNELNLWQSAIIAFFYDTFAFAPQYLVGIIHEKYKEFDFNSFAVILMLIGLVLLDISFPLSMAGIVLIALGNMVLHDTCAIHTVKYSNGTLFPSAIFVGGGSFGLIIGQTIGGLDNFNKWFLIIPIYMIFSLSFLINKDFIKPSKYPKFDLVNRKMPLFVILFSAFFITFIRSYIGYAIPIAWKKELWQAFILFFLMGFGKMLGGFLADKFGAFLIGILSSVLCIPFLIAGENNMIISCIGVFIFSMTMSITFGMFLSVYNKNPGFAFGLTTIPLLLGAYPIFFIEIPKLINIILIISMMIVCGTLFALTLKRKKEDINN